MWVQKIPGFHSGHILKQEMMVELSAYLYHLGPLLYQNCTDGIVSGCTLTTTEDSIVVNPGVIRYEAAADSLHSNQYHPGPQHRVS